MVALRDGCTLRFLATVIGAWVEDLRLEGEPATGGVCEGVLESGVA